MLSQELMGKVIKLEETLSLLLGLLMYNAISINITDSMCLLRRLWRFVLLSGDALIQSLWNNYVLYSNREFMLLHSDIIDDTNH